MLKNFINDKERILFFCIDMHQHSNIILDKLFSKSFMMFIIFFIFLPEKLCEFT